MKWKEMYIKFGIYEYEMKLIIVPAVSGLKSRDLIGNRLKDVFWISSVDVWFDLW